MSDSFVWRDRKGIEHLLDGPDLIEAESDGIAAELEALEPGLAAADDRVFLEAFAAARPLHLRAARVAEDLDRWDQHATGRIVAQSEAAVAAIAVLVQEAKDISTLHESYFDFESACRAGDISMRSAAPLPAQRAAIATACARLGKPVPVLTTFDAAQAWLVNEPTTNRVDRPRSAPMFLWMDRYGHHLQLRSIRPLEQEYVHFVFELEVLVPELASGSVEERRIALIRASDTLQRISVLQSNMAAWSAEAIQLTRDSVAEWRKART